MLAQESPHIILINKVHLSSLNERISLFIYCFYLCFRSSEEYKKMWNKQRWRRFSVHWLHYSCFAFLHDQAPHVFCFLSVYFVKSCYTSHNLWHTIFRNDFVLHYSLKAQIYSMNVPIYFSVWMSFNVNSGQECHNTCRVNIYVNDKNSAIVR